MENRNDKMDKAKKNLYVIIGILTIASLAYRLIDNYKLEQTAVLFICLPSLLAVLVVRFMKRTKNKYSLMAIVITLFLLISSILLGEGFVCIIMAAPLFYGVPLLILAIFDLINRKGKQNKLKSLVLIPVILVCAEGIDLSGNHKENRITTSKQFKTKINLNILNESPNFMNNLPSFFKIGFPMPIEINGNGIEVGDERIIKFESSTKGIGELHLRIKESTKNKIIFEIVSNTTHIAHWLTWKEIQVNITENNIGSVVNWTSTYTCDLEPSWYFEPIERYAIQLNNNHLINSYFN